MHVRLLNLIDHVLEWRHNVDKRGRQKMQLANEVKRFSGACEQLLSAIAMNRPLSVVEAQLIQYYCHELSGKIDPILQQPPQ